MKVAIDVRPITAQPAGIGQYARCLVDALAKLDDPPELLLFGNRATETKLLPVGEHIRFFPMPNGLLWHEAARMSFLKSGADVYHSPSSAVVPMALRERAVITVHDLVPLLFPETTTLRTRLGYRMLRRAVRFAGGVIAVSENTRADLERVWALDRPVHVVHEAARPLPEGRTVKDVESPYFLAVGTLEPRKNLPTLIEAYAGAAKGHADFPSLVLVGPAGWGDAPAHVRQAADAVADRIHLLGFRGDEELADLYRRARAFVSPSLYEGFGLPALEAMAAGIPVAAAASGAQPEVLGEAALFFDPEDTGTLSEILRKLAVDDAEHERLRAAGARRAAQFSWERTARETRDVYAGIAAS